MGRSAGTAARRVQGAAHMHVEERHTPRVHAGAAWPGSARALTTIGSHNTGA